MRRGLLLLRQILLPPSLRRRTLKKDDDQRIKIALKVILKGNGCGTVGRAAAFDTIDPQFESSHWQFYLLQSVLIK